MIAKNNIFNIRYAAQTKWMGQTGENKGFVEFDTREHAIRAASFAISIPTQRQPQSLSSLAV